MAFELLQSYYDFQQAPVHLSFPPICERIYILKTCRIYLCDSQKSEITTKQQVPRGTENFNGKKASASFYSYETYLAYIQRKIVPIQNTR